jgi:hypothetical protein
MRSNLFLLSCLLVLCFTSCQKSIEWNDLVLTPTTPTTPTTPGGGTTTGTLLVKAVSLSLIDTLTALYSYDASKKVIKNQTIGTTSGSKVDMTNIYTRNSSGNIIKYIQINYSASSFSASGYDTAVTVIHYPLGSSNFDYVITQQEFLGFIFSDSTVFTYTAGKITKQTSYLTDFLTGNYIPNQYLDYTYDANGNVSSAKAYSYGTGTTPTLAATYAFTYDTKKSPLVMGNEAFIISSPPSYGPNNYSKYDVVDATTPLNSLYISSTYNYNSNNYPLDATITATRAGISIVTKSTLFYQ